MDILHPEVDIGHPEMDIPHPEVDIGHPEMDIPHPEVDIGHPERKNWQLEGYFGIKCLEICCFLEKEVFLGEWQQMIVSVNQKSD